MRQHPTQGIAIISALFMMVMVLGIGIGSIFLLQSNLRIAENSRSQTVAFYAAETAVEVARGQLQAHLDAGNTTLPATLTLQPVQSAAGVDYSFELDSYTVRNGGTEAVVNVLGFGPNDGEHASVVVLGSAPGGDNGGAFAGSGFVSEGVFAVNNFQDASLIDAEIHGNKGYRIINYDPAAFETCTARAANGVCQTTASIPTFGGFTQGRVSAGDGLNHYTCNLSGSGSDYGCSGRGETPARLVDPVNVDFSTTERRNENSAVYDENGNEDSSKCTHTRSSVNGHEWESLRATLGNDAVLCVNGNVNLSAGAVLNNIEIVADYISLNGSTTIEDSVVIARQGLNHGGGTISNSFIYSKGDLSFNNFTDVDDTADFDGDGDDRGGTTFVTEGTWRYSGSTRAGVDANGEPVSSMAVYAGNNIVGNNGSDIYGLLYAGNKATFSQNTTLYGSAYAKGNITMNGAFTIDAGIDIVNDDVSPPPGRLVVDAISRR